MPNRPVSSERDHGPTERPAKRKGKPGKGGLSALGNPHYRMLLFSLVTSWSAMQMQVIARGWLAAELTGDAAIVLGLVAMATGLPQLIVSPFGGAFADRLDKRTIVIVAQCTLGLVALINAILVAMGTIQVWHLYVLGLVQGAVFSFNMPARQAMLPELLGRDNFIQGIALNNAAINVTRIGAPAIAGFLIAFPLVGLTGVFFIIAGLYLFIVYGLFKLPKSPPQASHVREPVLTEVRAGVSYVRRSPNLLVLLSLSLVMAALALPYQSLLPIFARTVHDVGSEGLGLFFTVSGVGALIGSLVVAMLSSYPRKGQIQLAGGAACGVFLALFALSPNYPLALLGLGVATFWSMVFMSLNNTLIMLDTSPEYYGRVLSISMMTFSLMPVAALPMSAVAEAVGAPWAVGGAAILLALIMLGVVAFLPSYWRRDTVPVGGRVSSSRPAKDSPRTPG